MLHRAGEGALRAPFEPLAAGRARPARPAVVAWLVADQLHRAAVVAHGDGAAVFVRGNAVAGAVAERVKNGVGTRSWRAHAGQLRRASLPARKISPGATRAMGVT